ncbi:inorganic diphosphatase [Methylomonas montana]|uniref:inorganic diphosphatase n=1 Tax=Methylomonas montana TaxID=3058963 RepID=UPI002657BD48|nr:inorganic diphosphatase [Methylomonas montana]WKJ89897.1 inorganic diphosphatase [Methylomonas montana]
MSFMQVAAGENIPFEINVVVEIPAFSDPVKYEVDKHTGALTVDRFMGTAMQYPCNYGYIPQTLSEDGDPVDVMIITPAPLLSGCVINCRPVGVLKMIDEAGPDPKLLAVPMPRLTPFYNHVTDYQDMQPDKLAKITHFFQHYKDLEEGKWVSVEGWGGLEEARQEIIDSVGRYKSSHSSRR